MNLKSQYIIYVSITAVYKVIINLLFNMYLCLQLFFVLA